MYFVFKTNSKYVKDMLQFPIENADDIVFAKNTAGHLLNLNSSYSFVSEAFDDIESNCLSGKSMPLVEYMHNLERKVRGYLFESKAYLDHMGKSLVDPTLKTDFKNKVQFLRDHEGVFAFTWELRNYITHQGKLVHFIIGDDRHPGISKTTLKGYKRDGGVKSWRWASQGYIETLPDSIDLVDIFRANNKVLHDLHVWLMTEMLKKFGSEIDVLNNLRLTIIQQCNITSDELGNYAFGQAIYGDDKTDIPEKEYLHPTNFRERAYSAFMLDWRSIAQLETIKTSIKS